MLRSGNIKTVDVGSHTSDLICPRCGGENLHHDGATFFDRSEDAPQEVVIKVHGSSASSSIQEARLTENPSSRRHGMLIHFSCETCPSPKGRINLAIAQHKGCTEISWQFDPA